MYSIKGKVDMEQGVVYITALLIAFNYYYPQWVWQSGSKKYAAGDYDGSIKIFTRIAKWWWLGRLWMAQALCIEPINSIALATRGWCIWQSTENAVLALNDLDRALALSGISASAQAYKGAVLLGSGSFEEAVTCFSNAVRIEPNKPYHYIQRASAFAALLQSEKALTDCDAAVKLSPEDASLIGTYGRILQQLGKFDDAIEQCQLALEISPSSATAIYSFAAVLHENNRTEEALTFWERRFGDKLHQFHFRLNRAVFLTKLLRYEEALADCDIALTHKPSWRINVCRAYIHLRQGDLRQCDLELKAVEALHPNEPIVVSNRARCLIAMEKFQESVGLLKAFVETDKFAELNYKFLNTEGIAYKALGDLSSAQTFFRRSLTINSKSLEAVWHQGDTLEKLGDLEQGRADKNKAIESGYVEGP
jgi:tetratricopeptide (TPR) repeat protein